MSEETKATVLFGVFMTVLFVFIVVSFGVNQPKIYQGTEIEAYANSRSLIKIKPAGAQIETRSEKMHMIVSGGMATVAQPERQLGDAGWHYSAKVNSTTELNEVYGSGIALRIKSEEPVTVTVRLDNPVVVFLRIFVLFLSTTCILVGSLWLVYPSK